MRNGTVIACEPTSAPALPFPARDALMDKSALLASTATVSIAVPARAALIEMSVAFPVNAELFMCTVSMPYGLDIEKLSARA